MDITAWVPSGEFSGGWWIQTIFIAGITAVQAALNHYRLQLTQVLTDFSGYLILATAVVLTLALLAWAPSTQLQDGCLRSPTSPAMPAVPCGRSAQVALYVFALGLLHAVYTITGFDASAHTSEETRNAQREVPERHDPLGVVVERCSVTSWCVLSFWRCPTRRTRRPIRSPTVSRRVRRRAGTLSTG